MAGGLWETGKKKKPVSKSITKVVGEGVQMAPSTPEEGTETSQNSPLEGTQLGAFVHQLPSPQTLRADAMGSEFSLTSELAGGLNGCLGQRVKSCMACA